MKRLIYIFLILSGAARLQAQYLLSSNTTIESCNEIDSCLSVSGLSFLYYDASKSEFFLKVDLSDFRKPETDTIDNWLNKEKDTLVYYRMLFPRENFPELGMEERRTFKVNGRIFFANVWKDQSVQVTLFSSQNNLLTNTSTSTNYTNGSFDNYKLNFTIPFVPSDFKKYNKLYYVNQVVNINVTLGRVNALRPGMEPLLGDAYNQSGR